MQNVWTAALLKCQTPKSCLLFLFSSIGFTRKFIYAKERCDFWAGRPFLYHFHMRCDLVLIPLEAKFPIFLLLKNSIHV